MTSRKTGYCRLISGVFGLQGAVFLLILFFSSPHARAQQRICALQLAGCKNVYTVPGAKWIGLDRDIPGACGNCKDLCRNCEEAIKNAQRGLDSLKKQYARWLADLKTKPDDIVARSMVDLFAKLIADQEGYLIDLRAECAKCSENDSEQDAEGHGGEQDVGSEAVDGKEESSRPLPTPDDVHVRLAGPVGTIAAGVVALTAGVFAAGTAPVWVPVALAVGGGATIVGGFGWMYSEEKAILNDAKENAQ